MDDEGSILYSLYYMLVTQISSVGTILHGHNALRYYCLPAHLSAFVLVLRKYYVLFLLKRHSYLHHLQTPRLRRQWEIYKLSFSTIDPNPIRTFVTLKSYGVSVIFLKCAAENINIADNQIINILSEDFHISVFIGNIHSAVDWTRMVYIIVKSTNLSCRSYLLNNLHTFDSETTKWSLTPISAEQGYRLTAFSM